MNEEKKIPLWPLYLADALMFTTVLVMAFPNIILKKPLDGGQTFMLAILVLAAMALVLVPYVLQHKKQSEAKRDETPDPEKEIMKQQLLAVSSDLRTLRAKLAQQADKIEIAENSVSGIEKESSSQFAKLHGIDKAVENLKQMILEIASQPDGETENRIGALEARINGIKEDLEDFKNSFEEVVYETDSDPVPQGDEEAEEQAFAPDYAASDEDNFANEAESTKSMEEMACESAEDKDSCDTVDLSDDGDEAPLPYGEIGIADKSKAKSWEGLIDKALSNSQSSSTRDVVSRFIEKNKAGEAPATENGMESDIEEKLYSGTEDDEAESEYEEIFEEEPEFAEEMEDMGDFEDSEFVEEETVVQEASEEETPQEQSALFAEDETPRTEKPKRIKSGDTAIVANAFPGIGNKLYVRGNGGGLSMHEGAPMQMIEIGKWQWKCEALLNDEIKISIWLNDEIQSTTGELTLKPNETLETEISFKDNA